MSQALGERPMTLADLTARLESMATLTCEEEGLSELDHGLQCAEVLCGWAPDDVELQIAGLIHDLASGEGHIEDHGQAGALAVQALLGERIAELVRLHVDAKRYLVTRDPGYRESLSQVSLATFELQGGMMSTVEFEAFASNPYRDDALRLREADDLAKVPGKVTIGLHQWLAPIAEAARGREMISPIGALFG